MMTMVAIAGLVAAVLLVRAGWAGQRALAIAGWALAAALLLWMTMEDGAWGLATGLTAASVAALLVVLQAAIMSPARFSRAGTGAQTAARAVRAPLVLGRRFAIFFAVVPLSFVAAQWFAYTVLAAIKGDSPLDANSVSMMMFVQPVAWAILMTWQMTLSGPTRMMMPPALLALAGALIWMIA